MMQHTLIVGLPKLATIAGQDGPPSVRFHSTPKYMELVVRRPHAEPGEHPIQPPPVEGDPPIAVRAHRSVVMQAVAAGDFQKMLGPLLTGAPNSPTVGKPKAMPYRMAWSPDKNWVTLSTGPTESLTFAPTNAGEAAR
jgi:hypothetical protein